MKVLHSNSGKTLREFSRDILEPHYREVGNTKVYDLDPDWRRYDAIASQDGLAVTFIFDDLIPVGYAASFLSGHIHYQRQRIATNDVIFIFPAYRQGSAGGRLMAAHKAYCKERGAILLQWHAKPDTALDKVLAKRVPRFENAYQEML